MSHDVLILGASTRAAAFSALRCGLTPRCADYFADRDLAAVCPVERIDPRDAARQFTDWAESIPPSPWFYTGGFENHPDWVDRIADRHALWGVGAEALRAVRDPTRVADVLSRHGIPCPAVHRESLGLARDGTWLEKPIASGGGYGIEPLSEKSDRRSPAHYFQERIAGPSFSALFMGWCSGAGLIGVARQLIGVKGSPFAYRGSVGPIPLTDPLAARLRLLGDVLTRSFDLAGWFGVDFILRDGIPWPVEINPRYTASVETHELATGRSLLAEHRDACAAGATAPLAASRTDFPASRFIAKSILYAPRRLVVPAIFPEDNELDNPQVVPSIADVPWPETTFEIGEPVMTVMAAGADLTECQSRMIRLVRTWTERLGIAGDDSTMDAVSPDPWCSGDDDALVL